MALSRFEKRLSIFALVFVVIYLGAAALTIQSNYSKEDAIPQIESSDLTPAEGRLAILLITKQSRSRFHAQILPTLC